MYRILDDRSVLMFLKPPIVETDPAPQPVDRELSRDDAAVWMCLNRLCPPPHLSVVNVAALQGDLPARLDPWWRPGAASASSNADREPSGSQSPADQPDMVSTAQHDRACHERTPGT